MIQLLPEQAEDLRDLLAVCQSLGVAVVVIGAVAYRAFVDDPYRTTEDVDTAVALDLDAWPDLAKRLSKQGWRQRYNLEHRWEGSHGAIIDIIPAGTRLREEGRIVWPKSQMTMSLVGFDHVFRDCVVKEIAPGMSVRVVTLPVLALLKIVAFLDDPHSRRKDAQDIARLLREYERDGERRFSSAVFDAGLSFECAGAFLLGMDLARLCTSEEARLVEIFLDQINDEEHPTFSLLSQSGSRSNEGRDEEILPEINALTLGFRQGRS